MMKNKVVKQYIAKSDRHLKVLEIPEVEQFLFDHVMDEKDPRAEMLLTRELFATYVKWRKKKGRPPTAYTMNGFARLLPFARKQVYVHRLDAQVWGIPGKRLV